MAKEFMLYIRNTGDAKASLARCEHLTFIRQCEVYIGRLKAQKKLIAAQPLVREGCIISKSEHGWTSADLDMTAEVQVGYYHIVAASLEEAVSIAKENPEFEFVPSASIEIRPVKMKEEQTGFVYPEQ